MPSRAGWARTRNRWTAGLQLQAGLAQKETVQRGELIYSGVLGRLGQPGTYPGSPGYKAPATGGQARAWTPAEQARRGYLQGELDVHGDTSWNTYGSGHKGSGQEAIQLQEMEKRRRENPEVEYVSGFATASGQTYDPKRFSHTEGSYFFDPGRTVSSITQSKDFQIMSQLTAEAGQFVNRQGPAWERFRDSVQGPLKQGAAQSMQMTMDSIEQNYAQGGTARNRAMQDYMKVQAQIDVNMQHYSALSSASLAMDQWAIENARVQTDFNQAWAQNQPGVRANYINGMNAAAAFMSEVSIPAAQNANAIADAITSKKKKGWAGILTSVITAYTGYDTITATNQKLSGGGGGNPLGGSVK